MAEQKNTFNVWFSKDSLIKSGVKAATAEIYYPILIKQMQKANINTEQRQLTFLAQILHESGNFGFTKENLNYTADGLMKTWPSKFNASNVAMYAKQPEKIANFVYGSGNLGRDLGNVNPGDGWKYIGRGLIGVTGRFNYTQLAKDTGIDFVNHPEYLEKPEYAVIGATWYWAKHNINATADLIGSGKPYIVKKGGKDINGKVALADTTYTGKNADTMVYKAITKRINGGQIGAADRESKYAGLLKVAVKTVVDNQGTIVKVAGIGYGFFLSLVLS